MTAWFLVALVVPPLLAAPLGAQDPEAAADDAVALVTDRPDFTESAVVVGRGSLQLESGMSWQRQGSSRTAVSGPEALLRWGVARRLELRLALPDYVHTDDRSGLGDAAVGLKAQLGPLQSGWELAAIAAVSLPTGEDEFSSDGADPFFVVTAGRQLSPHWTFGGQLSIGWPTIAGDRDFEWGATAVLGRGLTPALSSFLEVATTLPDSAGTATLVHHGYVWRARPRLQLDVHVAAGVSDAAPDWLVGAGFGLRP